MIRLVIILTFALHSIMVGSEAALEAPSEPGAGGIQPLLAKSGIPDSMWSEFQIFKPEEFGALAAQDVQSFIDSLVFPSEISDVLIKARIRLLWKRCSASDVAPEPGPLSMQGSGVSSKPASSSEPSTWSDAFPKKLSSEAVKSMVAKFSQKYPSEPLGPEVMPSPRLLALVHSQIQDRRWRWVPWKLRLSEEQHDTKSLERSLKAPRLESVLFEEVPSRDLPVQSMGKSQMQELLHLQAVAIAMSDGAHLFTLREMNRRFISKCFESYPKDAGLRPPNRVEAELADQKLWQQIATLFNEEEWSLDQAIREVVVARNELGVQLMPRAAPPKALWVDRFRKGNGKGKDPPGRKGDKGSKGSGKDGKGNGQMKTFKVNGFTVGTSWQSGKNRRLLCNDFQSGKCNRDSCKFEHVCGVLLPGNKMCLGDHSPMEHRRTPH